MEDYRAIFAAITSDARYLANLDWGEPRWGHPEGTIRNHIAELESNLAALRPRLSGQECWKLKLLIHTHDTFKPEAIAGAPITDPASHASLARAFLAEFCDEADLLAMVQHHDEPFALWRQLKATGSYDAQRFAELLAAIRDWNVFLAFEIIDGCTDGKSRAPLRWFFARIEGRVQSRITAADIL